MFMVKKIIGISEKDKRILRDLAKRLAEIAHQPIQKEKAEIWRRHNRLERVRPLVLFHMEEFCWQEVLSDEVFETTDPIARKYEIQLRRRLYEAEYLKDDRVVEPIIEYPTVIHDTGFGVYVHTVAPDELRGAVEYKPVIKTEKDIEKIKTPQISIDWEATERNYQQCAEIFGDILTPVSPRCNYPMAAFMDWFAMMRGIEQLYKDIVERPGWVHQVMERMTTGWLSRLDQLAAQGGLGLNNRSNEVGSGGLGFTDELPQKDFDGRNVRPIDMWGFATSQVFAVVSPAMHEEFALQYERRYLERLGLNCYGCCEPLEYKMDFVKKIPRLRRVSMSQWVDREKAAAELGDKYIYSFKPTGNHLFYAEWNPDAVRADLRDVLEKTKGCVVELVNNSVSTCRGEP
ncbi:hypothetical protein J7M23_06370, partial [Candidatus Sumerlaeota bacterium]|nr:hypothetical protein [Candidatus Sumerlaeota bacterium]